LNDRIALLDHQRRRLRGFRGLVRALGLAIDLEQIATGLLRCDGASSASLSESSFTGILIWREAIRCSFVGDDLYIEASGRSRQWFWLC
jgi:hypothetical protein